MSNFNVCEQELKLRYDDAVVDFIGELARLAVTVEEERAVYAVGACLIEQNVEVVAA